MNDNNSIIQVRNLVKRFDKLVAVDHISFEVKEGEIFGFLGPNGAGKSTTIKMLTTLLNYSEGEISINDKNPLKNQDEVRKSFGIVFQDPSLDDDLTAWENMNLHAIMYKIPVSSRKKRIQEMLEFVELWDRRSDLVKTYSGGMKRRLEIARGLLHHPKILFLDEPTLGLDPQTRSHMWNYLQEINQTEGMTIFFTTHYIEEAEKIANHVAVIDNGKIVSTGTPLELMTSTQTNTLEEAFLSLTGHAIREEQANGLDMMRAHHQARTRS